MAYVAWRDAIVAHGKAAALAVDTKWTDVGVGVRNPDGRCARVYYGGEVVPPMMSLEGSPKVLNGEMVGERILVVAFWPLAGLGTSEYAVVDTEIYAWKDELRTRLQGDNDLGGTCSGLDLQYAEPDIAMFNNARFALLLSEVHVAYTEYAIA